MRAVRAIMASLVAAACSAPAQQPAAPATPAPAADTCGAGAHAALLGRDATALERVLIMRQVRIVRPGDENEAPGAGNRPARINFVVGAQGRIVRIVCG